MRVYLQKLSTDFYEFFGGIGLWQMKKILMEIRNTI